MDDRLTISNEDKRVLEVIDAAATANSRRRFDELAQIIDAGDRLIAQQIVARTAQTESAVRVAEVVMENPTAKKSWRNIWGLV